MSGQMKGQTWRQIKSKKSKAAVESFIAWTVLLSLWVIIFWLIPRAIDKKLEYERTLYEKNAAGVYGDTTIQHKSQ